MFLPGVANSFSQAFAPILGGTISAAMTILGNLFVWLCGLIGELVNTVVQPALALLLEIWQGVMDGITAAWQAYGQPILDGLVQAFQGLTDLLTSLWQSVLPVSYTHLDVYKRQGQRLAWQSKMFALLRGQPAPFRRARNGHRPVAGGD